MKNKIGVMLLLGMIVSAAQERRNISSRSELEPINDQTKRISSEEQMQNGIRVMVQHAPGTIAGFYMLNSALQNSANRLPNSCIVNADYLDYLVGFVMVCTGVIPMVRGCIDVFDSGMQNRDDCCDKCCVMCAKEWWHVLYGARNK